MLKLMREAIELADVLNHFTEDKCSIDEVYDEIADVEIMLAQVVYLLSRSDSSTRQRIDDIKAQKIIRQMWRMQREDWE